MKVNNNHSNSEIIRYVVCIPVCKSEESILSYTLRSVIYNTTPRTVLLVVSLGADWELILEYKDKVSHLERKVEWIGVQTIEPCLPYSAIHYLPAQYQAHDIIFVLPGVEVPYGWDARLALAAMQDDKIASVSPLCDISPLFALLDNNFSQNPDLSIIDRLAYNLGQRRNIEVPVLLCSCIYLRKSALNVIGLYLNDNHVLKLSAFCWTLSKLFNYNGFYNVCCDHIYIIDRNVTHFNEMEELSIQEEVQLINQSQLFTSLRQAVRNALVEGNSDYDDPTDHRPVQLHIAHTWGGGQERWLTDYCESDIKRKNLVLRSIGTWGLFGKRTALYHSYHMDTPLRCWDLDYPIRSSVITNLQYKSILQEIIDEFGVEIIVVSSLIGHSLDVLNTRLKTVYINHDYYPFCPAINIYFNGVCEECTDSRLKQCCLENKDNRYFNNTSVSEWQSIRKKFIEFLLKPDIIIVSPSKSVSHHMKALVSEFRDKQFRIIHHGISFKPVLTNNNPVCNSGKLRIIILGSLVLHKGRKLLEEIYPELHNIVDFYLVGCGEDGMIFMEKPGIYLIPQYAYEKLPEIVNSINPHIGLLLSIVPETYSYTLSELLILNIPTVVTSVGSFADRIKDGFNGFVCLPTKASIIEKIKWVSENPVSVNQIRARLFNWEHRTTEEMVTDYHALTPLPAFAAPRYFSPPATLAPVEEASPRTLYVDAQAPFARVLDEFGDYACQKLVASPRLRAWQKRGLAALLAGMLRAVRAVATLRRKG